MHYKNALEGELLGCMGRAKNSSNTPTDAVLVEVRVAMDVFEQRYYRLLTLLLKLGGYWPSQTNLYNWGIMILASVIGTSTVIPVLAAAVKHSDDITVVLDCAIGMTFTAMLTAKSISSKFESKKVFRLLNHIRTDWSVWKGNREIQTLYDYTEQGRKIVAAWVVVFISTPILWMTQPVLKKIIDVLLRNGSKPGEFPQPVDYYFIDERKYYFYIIAHILVSVELGLLVVIPFDSLLIISVKHGCGIFAALGKNLNKIGINMGFEDCKKTEKGDFEYALNKGEMNAKYLAWCIRRHRDAIEFAHLIESTFSRCFFLVSGLNILSISISGYQIVKGATNVQETSKFVVALVATLFHTFAQSYMSQILMDHSINIRNCIQSSKWYELTPKLQKLLYVMMIRCNVPCKLTSGKMSVMCLETFAGILKSSMSFLTVLRTM